MMILEEKINLYKKNIEHLNAEISKICEKTGRKISDVLIIAASKYADVDQIKEVKQLSIINFGENRADELLEKYNSIGNDVIWHFIGHLQSRKVKIVVPLVDYIHSIDNTNTLEKINEEALKINKVQKVLIEVNISGEESKYGINIEDVENFLIHARKYSNVEIRGLMTMAPLTDDMEFIRVIFRKLKELKDRMNSIFTGLSLTELSMGMSNDFKIAIEEGATMIRVGSSIFT